MNKHISKFVLALGLFSAMLVGLSRSEDVAADTYGFRVTPVEVKENYAPGKTYTGSMTIINAGDMTTKFKMTAQPYTGNYDSMPEEWLKTHTQIVDWVTFATTEGTIEPNEQKKISYTITIPSDVPAGGQYVSLNVEGVDERNKNLPATVSVGMVVYANVSGNTREEIKVLDHSASGFIFSPPITASSTVENTGNTHVEAKYIMKVYPFFSNESIYNNEDNPETAIVLPESKRYHSTSWDSAPSMGIYKVVSEIHYLGQVNKVEKLVIICPLWVLILIIIFIAAVVFWLVSRAKARKADKVESEI